MHFSLLPGLRSLRSRILPGIQSSGIFLGPLLALCVFFLLPDTYAAGAGEIAELGFAGRVTAAIGVWMAVWWLTEAVNVSVTALLPLALLPLTGAASMRETAAPYAHELIFLFMGGFILALSMERWGLHRRIALHTLGLAGTKPVNIIGSFMAVTAVLSMWVSNTATVIMMLPIAQSLILLLQNSGGEKEDGMGMNFRLGLMLGIAYAASIGGVGTVIGTPPNLFVVSWISENLGREIGFVEWMILALPLVIVFLPLSWWILTRVLFPVRIRTIEGSVELARQELKKLGPMNRGERSTFLVFLLAVILWITRPLLQDLSVFGAHVFGGLTDTGIAMGAAMLLFVLPVNFREHRYVMNWETTMKMPWGVLILFGGGLTLAKAVQQNGVSDFIGAQVQGLAGMPEWIVVLVVVALMIFLTELTSNTATTATLVPILAGIAPALGVEVFMLVVPAAIAASCAFMMPVATPPNAIVFSSGYVTIPQMARAGIWLNIVGTVLITLLAYAVIMLVLGAG